jgi:starch-binding outer membrane protein, SusD/RagB family
MRYRNSQQACKTRSGSRRLLVVPLLVLLGACDFSVANPGPVRDDLLDLPGSRAAIVNGTERALAEALGYLAYTGGAVSREINAAGSLNICGVTLTQREGRLVSDEIDSHWNLSQRARWMAEDGTRRLRSVLGTGFASDVNAAKILLLTGYANRLLGENMGVAVIDGGSRQPNRVYFERAEAGFTEALEVARSAGDTRLVNAALAGRASVRIFLDSWGGAVADAEQVPENFVYAMPYFDTQSSEFNRLFWCNANQPYRAHTVFGTYYEAYYTETGDPRVRWTTNPSFPVGDAGQITWYPQMKHDSRTSPIRLSTGREMRLIRAEADLRSGNREAALAKINVLRAEVGMQPWQATTLEEAWTRLKRERGIELWLEARRLGDLRRWNDENIQGEAEDMQGRDLSFPIGLAELETNPNLR